MIYIDHAATTPLLPMAYKAMLPYLKNNFGNPSSSHKFGLIARKIIEQARKKIANLINAEPNEIIFTSGGTESDNLALNGAKTLFISNIEHKAVLNKALDLRRNGAKVHFLPVDNLGIVDEQILEEITNRKKGLVSIIFANNEIGTIQNIKKMVKIAHRNNCLFHTDAVQAVGHIHIDVKELNVDLLSASAHKFGGPKGIGFLYVKKGIRIKPLLVGGHQENGLRAGTENVANIIGMATALEWQIQNMENNTRKLLRLEKIFKSKISSNFLEAKFNGYENYKLPGLISMTLPKSNSESLFHILDLKGICASVGAACDSQKNVISHVLKAIGFNSKESKETLRISFGYSNTLKEIEFILQIIRIYFSNMLQN